ncbi:MAG: sodium:solute symporter family protein [Vicinamibacterales bacterium]|nr:sodium:solute symporter family protein [Vicinamibacterales bacterium]
MGAGSTVGATGLGYRDGLSAWWWNGSAAIGSLLLAFWIGPRAWRQASAHGFLTTGDLLEHHFGRTVRGLVTAMLWLATLSILAGQLVGIAWILSVVAGLPKWAGCLIGGGLMTAYFAAGGLLGSAWVNLVQLVVLLCGFAIVLPAALSHAGGLSAVMQAAPNEGFGAFWNGATSISFLVLLVPAFISSPGLLQKAFGAKSERAVRLGIGWNAAALFVFACVPAVLGLAARVHHAGLTQELALPTLLASDLPVGLGAILLAAIFSAEVSTADAVLFMLATSLSQDLYRRFLRPDAADRDVLRVARWAAVAGGGCGILLALVTPTIVGALSFFYAMIGATLFVPILVALHARVNRRVEVTASILAGAAAVLTVQLTLGITPGSIWTPATIGLLSASAVYGVGVAWRSATLRQRA